MDTKESQSQGKVLVLGIDDRSALTVIRSLGRKGIIVHLGKDVPFSICELSKYTRKVISLPNSGSDPDSWVQELAAHLEREKYDLVIPTADNYLVLAVKHRQKLEKFAHFAIPGNQGFTYTYNKSDTLALAQSLGVPCPTTLELSSTDDIPKVYQQFDFPVFVKPVSSKVWQKNKRHNLKPELVKDKSRFEKIIPAILEICPVLIQSYHPGIGVGLEFLAKDSQPIAVFQHQRVHEPLGGGGSSYRKSVPVDPVLLDHSQKLLEAINWTGVAMVEYKYNPATDESVLMEINGRFWGSLPLAVAAGVDFPFLLYDMLANGRTLDSVSYKENIFCRNPVKDLDWLKENIRADKRDPYIITIPLLKVLAEFRNFFLGREYLDTIVWDDPKPGLIQLKDYFLENLTGAYDKLYKLLTKLNYRFSPFAKRKDSRRIRKLLAQNPDVAFVCKGNICRSPFAEFYLRSKISQNGAAQIKIDSFGLIDRVNRPSPENALAAATHFNIDMGEHRSKLLTNEIVKKSGVLFVMDIDLYRRVKALHPASKNKLFYLGVLLNGEAPSIEITDPYGKNAEQTTRTFSLVKNSLDNLIRLAGING